MQCDTGEVTGNYNIVVLTGCLRDVLLSKMVCTFSVTRVDKSPHGLYLFAPMCSGGQYPIFVSVNEALSRT